MLRRLLLLALLIGAVCLAWGYAGAVADPEIRRARFALPNWPAGARPVRAVLLSDIHIAGPDMPPERLASIVQSVAALKPDLVLIAGDFVSDKAVSTHRYSQAEAVAPLRRLRPPLGIFAVPGNHDHWRDEEGSRRALTAIGVRVLDNEAVQAGPLALGGIDDAFTGNEDLPAVIAAMRGLDGAKLLLSHSPDPFPDVPSDIALMVSGHTHCGQIRLPWIGAIATMSRYGNRYACGLVRERGKALVVSAGLGTSILPLRIGTPPDFWVLELGPKPVEAR